MLASQLGIALVCAAMTAAANQHPAASGERASAQSPGGALRTFLIDKPAPSGDPNAGSARRAATVRLPKPHDLLRTTVGLGYVQGADWGAAFLGSGGVAGRQVQFQSLITSGRDGFVFDQGTVSIFDPEVRWRVEAGDLFSHLRGASRGARLSWQPANGRHRPTLTVHGPHRGSQDRTSVLSFRDQLRLGEGALMDAELASDRSFALRNQLRMARVEVEGFYRSRTRAQRTTDASLSAAVTLWRGVGISGGIFRSSRPGERSEWRTVAVRLPLTRLVDLTLERAFTATGDVSQTTSAASASVVAGELRLFHRHQLGAFDFTRAPLGTIVERQQTQSLASYNPGSRLNVTLQLATQRVQNGRIQHWQEMQTTLRLTSTTTLRAVSAVPDVRKAERWRAYFRQQLPSGFALEADYGRLSAFQSVPSELDRSRFKLMLFKTVGVATPARGAHVTGRVVDDRGRAVPGAGVRLGPFLTESDATGAYEFRHVPPGTYQLSLDRHLLPASVAWDGRQEPLTLTPRSRVRADLHVAPLDAIHGRVYCDRNRNGQFDAGEAVAGAVLQLADRVTATDRNGAYSFYNLSAAQYVVRLHTTRLPREFAASAVTALTVTLGDSGPVTGADFKVVEKVKPIIWMEDSR